ncbi:MAG: hypothetical protein E3J67_00665 [Dehalococcoidia bacterium]|nr:MAG: hypothetical protein E3J67_00665 [Dehalococcoidia bacterium]
MTTWSAPIWLYLWLAGMAGGAYFAAFLAERFTGNGNGQLLRIATYLGAPLAVVGVILLVADLGNPIRFWHLLTVFKAVSPMSIGTWILLIWIGVAVVMAILWWAEASLSQEAGRGLRQITGALSWIGFVFAILVMAYTGVLLATSSQPLWTGTLLLPALFVASAVSTGVAMLIISGATGRTRLVPGKMVSRLAEADAILIVVELVVLVGYAIWLSASSTAGTSEALALLTSGALALPFWLGVVLLALLIPLGLEFASWGKKLETGGVWRTVITSSVFVILGGLILRAVIVIGGQI